MKELSPKKKIVILVAALFLLFIILDLGFFLAGAKFIFRGRTEVFNPNSQSVQQKKGKANWLKIPSLGIEAPIVYTEEMSEQAYQEALINGVVHYPKTALPGELGNCYIFGHSSDYMWSKGNYKTIFAILPKIHIGDQIEASDQDGNIFTYQVIASKQVAANDLSVLDQQENKKKLLSLQTSYPIGTALARWVVVGEIKN